MRKKMCQNDSFYDHYSYKTDVKQSGKVGPPENGFTARGGGLSLGYSLQDYNTRFEVTSLL
jgi:hypothetical protein